jgi:hypothetical protein
MEKLILTSLLAAFCLGIAAATIVFYILVFCRPTYFAPNPDPYTPKGPTGKEIAFFLAVMIGTGACVHGGTLHALAWVPHSWRVMDDDGEMRWAAEGVALLMGAAAAVTLPFAAGGLAARLVAAERLATLLREELSKR